MKQDVEQRVGISIVQAGLWLVEGDVTKGRNLNVVGQEVEGYKQGTDMCVKTACDKREWT
jgi:hypothetical protein